MFLLGDGQAAFVPESGSASTVVLMHNVIVMATGARGLTLSLDRRGVRAGTVLEIGELLHHHETLREAVAVREESVARHEVWQLALTTFAALVRQAADSPAVVASLVQHDLVRLLCARLAVLQRPEVVVHGARSNEEQPEAWGSLPSAHLGAATTRRSEADTVLALQVMDALMAIAEISSGEDRVVQLMITSGSIPVLSQFVFDDEELAAAYDPDGRRASAHILWCRVLRFVSTLLRIFLADSSDRGNDAVVQQLMAFVGSHQVRLGLQWSSTEHVRSIEVPDKAAALPRSVWLAGGGIAVGGPRAGSNENAKQMPRSCPALGLAKLAGTGSLNTNAALLSLRSRGLSEAWLEEAESVARLLTVLGSCAGVWKSAHPEFFASLSQRLVDTVRVCTIILQADPVRDVARPRGSGSGSAAQTRREGGTFGRSQGRGSRDSSSGSCSSSEWRGKSGSSSRSASRRPSRHRSRQERQADKDNVRIDTDSRGTGGVGGGAGPDETEELAHDGGLAVHATDLFTRHSGGDQRLHTPHTWQFAGGCVNGLPVAAGPPGAAEPDTGDAGTPAEQKALAVTVHEGLLTVIRSSMHCLRALSPAPKLDGRSSLGVFSLPSDPKPLLPTIVSLQQLSERFAERRFASLLREQNHPLSCYHQGGEDSLYRSVAFQLNVEQAELQEPAAAVPRGTGSDAEAEPAAEQALVPWWAMADNDPEEVIEKVGMVLGLLQIFDKADVDGSGRLEEGECKDLLEVMFDDDRLEFIDVYWSRLLQRVGSTRSSSSLSLGQSGSKAQISKDEWVHVWIPPADPEENWVPLRQPEVTQSGRAGDLQKMFRLKGVDVYQELFDELAKSAQIRSSNRGKSVSTMDADIAIDKIPRALDLDRVLHKNDVAACRKDLRLQDGGQLTVSAWRTWLQGSSSSVKRIMRLKNEQVMNVLSKMMNVPLKHNECSIQTR